MATYVKGADTYLPDIKPFTPDYKFLSAVLQTRTDKYDANYKATNDLYNKVVYADLSREDTKARRDQYAEQIAPQIEQISGLDLSLASNVDAAKGVFAPFYDDDITVKDMVFTSRFRDQSQRAQNLLNSPDQTVQEKYWDVGVRGMQYKMDEFINSDPDQALGMALPDYVPKANLFKMSQQMLANMDPPLKMKMDRFAKQPNPNFNKNLPESRENRKEITNTDWIITEQNGSLVTGAALQQIRNTLLDNPSVQKSYQMEAYVSGMDWATQAVESGAAASLSNGQELWASETIKRIEERNIAELNNDVETLRKLETSAVTWSNYKGQNGLVPGSELDKLNQEQLSDIEKYKLDIEAKKQIAQEVSRPTPTNKNLINKAYNLYMQSNIMSDMKESAQAWSARDYIYEMNPNQFAVDEKKSMWNMAEIRARAANQLNLAAYNANRRDANTMLDKGYQYDAEGNLVPLPWAEGMGVNGGGAANDLFSALSSPEFSISDDNTTTFAVDEDGEPTANSDIIGDTQKAYAEHVQSVGKDEINALLGTATQPGMLQLMNPKGNTADENQTYTINIPGRGEVNGSIEDLRRMLSATVNNDGTGGLKYLDGITELYNTNKDNFVNTRQQTKDDIRITQGDDADMSTRYDGLYNRMVGPNGIETKRKAGDVFISKAYEVYNEAFENNDILKATTTGSTSNKNIGGMLEAGMPGKFDQNGIPYTKEEHFQEALRRLNAGELTNTDQDWTVDGRANKDYRVTETMGNWDMNKVRAAFNSSTPLFYVDSPDQDGTMFTTEDTGIPAVQAIRGARPIDIPKQANRISKSELREEAGKVYDALTTNLNAALTDRMDAGTNSATFESIKFGIDGGYADVTNNITFEYGFNPLAPDSDAYNEVKSMALQIGSLKKSGTPYGIGIGNLTNEDQLVQKDPLAMKVFNLLMKDAQTWVGNPKRSNSAAIAPIFDLAYKSVYDIASKGDKTHAGFEISNMAEGLASKVKGSSADVAKQFGALTTDDIARLKGLGENNDGTGIFIVFPQSDDINIKARKNDYFSSTEIDILGGDNSSYAEYTVPNDNGITPTATYRIAKNGTGDYDLITEINRYNPYPTDKDLQANWSEYTTSTNTHKMDFSQGLPGIDLQVNQVQQTLEEIRRNNQALRKKDQAIQGK